MRIVNKIVYLIHLVIAVFLGSFFTTISVADDWPQWRGLERSGMSPETNLLEKWPEAGPKLIWAVENLGEGYSSASISEDRIYITGVVDKIETLTALDLEGNIIWQSTYGEKWKGSYPEARSTPTVESEYVYVMSGMGEVSCFIKKSGELKWSLDIIDKFDGEYHRWGMAESFLIVDNKLICTPGGSDASVVALEKTNGSIIWQSEELSEESNYCSPILIKRGGKKIISTQLADSFVGIDADNGKLLWSDEYDEYQDDPKDININSPLYADGNIFVTSGYDNPSAMYKLSVDGTILERTWVNEVLDVHVGGVVLVDGYIYGANWESNRKGNWVCLDWKTGEVMWEEKWINKGSIISAEGMLYCYEEKKANLALVKATPKKFEKISSFKVPLGKGMSWAHPAISNGRLYVRRGGALMVYDISKK